MPFAAPLLRSPGRFFERFASIWGRPGVVLGSLFARSGRSDEKRPTLTKHCACALRQASDLPQTTQNSIGNRFWSLLRNALQKERLKKSSRGLPRASWGRFGSLRDAPGAPRDAPGDLRSPSGGLPGAPWIVLSRPEASRGLPPSDLGSILHGIWFNLGSICVRFRFDSSFVPSPIRSFVCPLVRLFVRFFVRPFLCLSAFVVPAGCCLRCY